MSSKNMKLACRVLQDRLGYSYQAAMYKILSRRPDGLRPGEIALDLIAEAEERELSAGDCVSPRSPK